MHYIFVIAKVLFQSGYNNSLLIIEANYTDKISVDQLKVELVQKIYELISTALIYDIINL